MYDEALHIPALLYAPALWPRGGRIGGPRQQIDILPTVADALGFELRGGFVPGVSLLGEVSSDRTLYFSSWQETLSLALRRGDRKYIYFFRRSPMQVFDLSQDPMERHDLGSTVSAAESDPIERELLQWRQRAVDVFLEQH
jgi:lipoteichoic acid synthase